MTLFSNNQQTLSDQSLSGESVGDEINSPINFLKETITNNSQNDNNHKILPPNNSNPQSFQSQDDQNQFPRQLIDDEQQPQQNVIIRCAKSVGTGIYKALYSAGGFLADLFGITSPRYAYELHEYEKRQERIRQRQFERESEENGDVNDIEAPNNIHEPNHAF